MFNRWLIRCLFMLPVVLCGLAWVSSYSYSVFVDAEPKAALRPVGGYYYLQFRDLSLCRGSLEIRNYRSSLSDKDYPATPRHLALSVELGRLGGFLNSCTFEWRIPMWLPTLVAAGALVLIWRPGRPKPNPATAFPVEVTKRP